MSWWARALYLLRKYGLFLLGIQTRGVSVLLIKNDQIYLVKPSYRDHWSLPGGGIKSGESIQAAAAREVLEEANIGITKFENDPLGVYVNRSELRLDIVTVLIATRWQELGHSVNWEIDEGRFFSIAKLPPNTSPAVRRRIREYRSGKRLIHGLW